MTMMTTDFRGEDGAQEARAALARLLQLAPYVFPGVAVETDWKAALDLAQAAMKPGKGEGR